MSIRPIMYSPTAVMVSMIMPLISSPIVMVLVATDSCRSSTASSSSSITDRDGHAIVQPPGRLSGVSLFPEDSTPATSRTKPLLSRPPLPRETAGKLFKSVLNASSSEPQRPVRHEISARMPCLAATGGRRREAKGSSQETAATRYFVNGLVLEWPRARDEEFLHQI